jgi:hypothetical protein
MDGWMDGWMDGGREGGREGWMDEWMNTNVPVIRITESAADMIRQDRENEL